MPFKPSPPGDFKKVRAVRVSDNQMEYISLNFGKLSDGITAISKGGKYEQLVNQVNQLQAELAHLHNNL